MDALLALLPIPAYAAAIAAVALLGNRLLSGHDSGISVILTIDLDPQSPRGVPEEEPVRWNVQRLRRSTRHSAAPPAGLPAVGVGGFEGLCLP